MSVKVGDIIRIDVLAGTSRTTPMYVSVTRARADHATVSGRVFLGGKSQVHVWAEGNQLEHPGLQVGDSWTPIDYMSLPPEAQHAYAKWMMTEGILLGLT